MTQVLENIIRGKKVKINYFLNPISEHIACYLSQLNKNKTK
jgi:hypothetical protein